MVSLTVAKVTLNIHEHRSFHVFCFKSGTARSKNICILFKLINVLVGFEV